MFEDFENNTAVNKMLRVFSLRYLKPKGYYFEIMTPHYSKLAIMSAKICIKHLSDPEKYCIIPYDKFFIHEIYCFLTKAVSTENWAQNILNDFSDLFGLTNCLTAEELDMTLHIMGY